MSKSTQYKIAFASAFCFLLIVMIMKTLIELYYNRPQINQPKEIDYKTQK